MFVYACPVLAQGEITRQLVTVPAAPAVTVYTAKKILTMEPSNPEATAVAVMGKRILAVGSLSEVKAALGDRTFTINDSFQSKVVLPGLIDQHLHPFLGALTLSTEVIATEDWVNAGTHVQNRAER
jgi:predicted amidohydrolase YtcJ